MAHTEPLPDETVAPLALLLENHRAFLRYVERRVGDHELAEDMWRFSVGAVVASGPMTYSVGGRQYVAVAAGSSLFASPCTSSRLDSE